MPDDIARPFAGRKGQDHLAKCLFPNETKNDTGGDGLPYDFFEANADLQKNNFAFYEDSQPVGPDSQPEDSQPVEPDSQPVEPDSQPEVETKLIEEKPIDSLTRSPGFSIRSKFVLDPQNLKDAKRRRATRSNGVCVFVDGYFDAYSPSEDSLS